MTDLRSAAPSPPNAPRTLAPSRRPPVATSAAHAPDKIEYPRLLKGQGHSLATIAAWTGIPKSSLYRYLAGELTAASSR